MPRSSRRAKSWAKGFGLPATLGILILVAVLVSSLLLFVMYGDDLRYPTNTEHHVPERFRHFFARELDRSQGAEASEASLGKAQTNGKVATEERSRDEVGATPKTAEEQKAKIQPPVAAATAASGGVQTTVASAEGVTTKASSSSRITWKKHTRKSCQNYADGDTTDRSLEASKAACLKNDACVAIECAHGSESSCTLRAVANLVPYNHADCYELLEVDRNGAVLTPRVHPAYNMLLKEYPFQAVTTQSGNRVNIILVRSKVNPHQYDLYQKYKDEILFLGISSMNDYPLKEEGSSDTMDYAGMFPGFLHMMREPEKVFPPHVKTLLMSQSDFQLPDAPARDYSVPRKYDFTYSASDCDVHIDGRGWCGWSKNWSFVKEALVTMCGDYHLTGVLVATKDKPGKRAYTIPESCKGKMLQTTYLAKQSDYFNYLKQSRFAFLPQIHDASPRVSTQALAHDVPIFMNYYISGGWKYVNDKTGEFFHDMRDFRQQLEKILRNADIQGRYEPRKWVLENYGNEHSGKRLLAFVKEHFSHRVRLPKGTKLLLP